jgi:hypothetical protein
MGKLVHERIGGQAVHVGDCHVWAEIFYLDSPTNYREYLPHRLGMGLKPCGGGLVMLDELRSWRNRGRLSWLRPISMVFLAGFILYFAFRV